MRFVNNSQFLCFFFKFQSTTDKLRIVTAENLHMKTSTIEKNQEDEDMPEPDDHPSTSDVPLVSIVKKDKSGNGKLSLRGRKLNKVSEKFCT